MPTCTRDITYLCTNYANCTELDDLTDRQRESIQKLSLLLSTDSVTWHFFRKHLQFSTWSVAWRTHTTDPRGAKDTHHLSLESTSINMLNALIIMQTP